MNSNMLFETLSDNQRKKERRLPAMDHYMDEETGEIKSRPLSQSDMVASALIHRAMNVKNPAKLIHDFMFARQLFTML
jgi:hypothetical protein